MQETGIQPLEEDESVSVSEPQKIPWKESKRSGFSQVEGHETNKQSKS